MLKKWDQNCNVWKVGLIPVSGRIRARNPNFIYIYIKKKPEFLCSEKEIKIIIFQKRRLEFQSIQG